MGKDREIRYPVRSGPDRHVDAEDERQGPGRENPRGRTVRRTSRLRRHSRYRGTEDFRETRIHGDSPEAVDHRQTVRVVQLNMN